MLNKLDRWGLMENVSNVYTSVSVRFRSRITLSCSNANTNSKYGANIHLAWPACWDSTSQPPSHKYKFVLSSLSFFHTEASHPFPPSSLWGFFPAGRNTKMMKGRDKGGKEVLHFFWLNRLLTIKNDYYLICREKS